MNKLEKNIKRMKTEAKEIIAKAKTIKEELKEIKEYDDLMNVEIDFRNIAAWANEMIDLCLESYDEFDE
jgi:hypothetical protein